MRSANLTAQQAGLISCRICHLSSQIPPIEEGIPACPRCGTALHSRKPNSLARTWALLISAAILYVPANVLPITVSTSLGSTPQADTILSGVIFFYLEGSWLIAVIIFLASICIPIFKLITLCYLLICVQFKKLSRPRDKARLYRVIELVGRWSMIDVFVITLMIALIKLGAVGDFSAGPGGLYFAAVVVTTMFAANSFDPRLIWDSLEEDNV